MIKQEEMKQNSPYVEIEIENCDKLTNKEDNNDNLNVEDSTINDNDDIYSKFSEM